MKRRTSDGRSCAKCRSTSLRCSFVRLTVAVEACGSAQHWAREIRKLGHEVRLISPQFVRPFVKTNKTDAADAQAIWTAAQQPEMRSVAVKTEEQQAVLALHDWAGHCKACIPGACRRSGERGDAFALTVSMSIMSALLDTAQIAELIGCTRAHVTDRLSKREDFPRPRINVSRKLRKWSEVEVLAWAAGGQSKRRAISAAVSR